MRDKREKGWFWVENELIDNEILLPMERLLYMVLARHSDNETGESFPSIETLCKKTGVKDKRTIVNHLRNLENFGLISIVKQLGYSNRYYLNNIPKELVTKNVPSTKNDTGVDTKIVTGVVAKNVPLTRLNKKTNKKDPIKKETNFDVMIKEFTDNEELKTTIYDFIKMRKTIKKPITDKALNLTLNKLTKISVNEQIQIEVLNQSIFNSWQGIFEIKEETFKGKTFDIKPQNKIATLEDMEGW